MLVPVAKKPIVAQLLALGRPNLSDDSGLFFADQRETVSGDHFPRRQLRPDDRDIGRVSNEADDFRPFVARRAKHAFEVGTEGPAGQVQQDGGVQAAGERHVGTAPMLPAVCEERIDSAHGMVYFLLQRPRLAGVEV